MYDELLGTSIRLGQLLLARNQCIAVAESCTGGLIAQSLTETAGSSGWFERGFVVYSNAAKQEMLGVKSETLETFGAVSEATALALVAGALSRSKAHYAIAVTGIAGPTGGTADKPVGTVFLAWASHERAPVCERALFTGDRHAIRFQSAQRALRYWIDVLAVE